MDVYTNERGFAVKRRKRGESEKEEKFSGWKTGLPPVQTSKLRQLRKIRRLLSCLGSPPAGSIRRRLQRQVWFVVCADVCAIPFVPQHVFDCRIASTLRFGTLTAGFSKPLGFTNVVAALCASNKGKIIVQRRSLSFGS